MIGTIVGLLVIGLIAGFIARAVVPGRQSMSVLQTILLGIAGSFVGGFLGWILFGRGDGFVQPLELDWIGDRCRDRPAGLPADQAPLAPRPSHRAVTSG